MIPVPLLFVIVYVGVADFVSIFVDIRIFITSTLLLIIVVSSLLWLVLPPISPMLVCWYGHQRHV